MEGRKGFSLVEIIVAMGIFLLIISITMISWVNIKQEKNMEVAVDVVQSIITQTKEQVYGIKPTTGVTLEKPSTDRSQIYGYGFAFGFNPDPAWQGGQNKNLSIFEDRMPVDPNPAGCNFDPPGPPCVDSCPAKCLAGTYDDDKNAPPNSCCEWWIDRYKDNKGTDRFYKFHLDQVIIKKAEITRDDNTVYEDTFPKVIGGVTVWDDGWRAIIFKNAEIPSERKIHYDPGNWSASNNAFTTWLDAAHGHYVRYVTIFLQHEFNENFVRKIKVDFLSGEITVE